MGPDFFAVEQGDDLTGSLLSHEIGPQPAERVLLDHRLGILPEAIIDCIKEQSTWAGIALENRAVEQAWSHMQFLSAYGAAHYCREERVTLLAVLVSSTLDIYRRPHRFWPYIAAGNDNWYDIRRILMPQSEQMRLAYGNLRNEQPNLFCRFCRTMVANKFGERCSAHRRGQS